MAKSIAGTGNLNALIALARQYIGTPYHWGGSSPSTGFDCSGFVMWLYSRQGITLPRTTYSQYGVGTPIPKAYLRPGDIVFFEPGKGGPGHEGLYIGKGMFIESPHTGASIRISSLAGRRDYVGARRIIPGGASSLNELISGGQPQQTAPKQKKLLVLPMPDQSKTVGGYRLPEAGPSQQALDYSDTWRQIASLPNASDETKNYAQNAQVASGNSTAIGAGAATAPLQAQT